MADHVDHVNMNDPMLSTNIFSVKKEQCQEDSFVEEKLYISETAISIDSATSQGTIWHGKIKQYEESTCLDNIKTELASIEVAEVQNDNVKIEEEIYAGDIKIEFHNGPLYCDDCEEYYKDYCIKCGMLVHILNKNALNNPDSGAQEDIPNDILEIRDCSGQIRIFALRIIPESVKFGPFTGLGATECPWEWNGEKFVLDKIKSKYFNWMQFVNPTRNTFEGNLCAFRYENNIYYQSTRQIQAGEELLVYFSEEYRSSPNKIVKMDFVIATKDIIKDVFACTFCCLGFSSKLYLARHKNDCVDNRPGQFSIEELVQCLFCKIHLDPKEYYEHHVAFCCERNGRKGILATSPTTVVTTALNGPKRYLRHIYKCEQCKYKTKYQADLKQHTNNQHYEVKIYKCGICNSRFKTKEPLKLHMENKHAYISGKVEQSYSTIDYRKRYIKVEQSSSQDQKKMFKCSLCMFQAKYKQSLGIHMKTKHLKQFDYRCDKCQYKTNNKTDLKRHIKAKHLNEFDFQCDACEFRTNNNSDLKRHIKSKHLKLCDYKCDSCEYRANHKADLKIHIKAKHLKEFDYKCDICEYRTNIKNHLEYHIKTKHLKEYDFKCGSCEFATNHKHYLEIHVKTKHLKKFDYKCDKCEFETNGKTDLKKHIKNKHLKEFNYKCDLCEFATNRKQYLEQHIKTKHLQQFDYKCDTCEFETNYKHYLEIHIKTKHLKKFDYKCDNCEFETNNKTDLKRHIKSKHLKEFNHKCDLCEFGTNRKHCLEIHIKTKHLKEFDYKCDKCKYGTNRKQDLKVHIKTKHLKEFDHKCDMCEFGTNNKTDLKRHIKAKHM